jgi:hypothetical protein
MAPKVSAAREDFVDDTKIGLTTDQAFNLEVRYFAPDQRPVSPFAL